MSLGSDPLGDLDAPLTPAPAPPPRPRRPVTPPPQAQQAVAAPAAVPTPSGRRTKVVVTLGIVFTVCNLGCVVLILLMLSMGQRDRDAQPEDRLVAISRQYVRNLPRSFQDASEAVREGRVTKWDEVVKTLAQNGKPVADELGELARRLADKDGKITDPEAAADLLQRTGQALKR